jgi:hypothetical protein
LHGNPETDCASRRPVELVKIDAELAELDVIKGMTGVIEEFRPHLICELFPSSKIGRDATKSIEALLRPLGYQFYSLADRACTHRSHIDGDDRHFNFLLTLLSPGPLGEVVGLKISEE